jgi:hypothetical protein
VSDRSSITRRVRRDRYFAVAHPRPLPQRQVSLQAQVAPHVHRSAVAAAQPQLAFAH